jgi:hypothetical protein
MMRRMMLAAVAALTLAACNQGGTGPSLPPVQPGAQAPSTQTPAQAVQQANVTDEVRQQLITNIGQQLDQYGQNFAPGSTRPEGVNDEVVPMQPATDHRWNITMTANTAYTIVGACDGDCTNVDIELIDTQTGGVVASDMLADDYPVVNFTPTANGTYIGRLLMQNCSMAPCYAGARVVAATGAAPK